MKLYIVTIFLAFIFCSFGQIIPYELNPDKSLNQFSYKHWTSLSNLPTNSLLHCYQSSNGYLWISGYNGLIQFDGEQFRIFNKSNVKALHSNVIGRIAEDSKHNIWFTTQESGLMVKRGRDFESFGIDLGITHLNRALYIDKKDNVWSAAPGIGWFIFNGESFEFIQNEIDLKNIEVRCIVGGTGGDIWFATNGHGLFCYNNGKLIQYTSKEVVLNDWIHALHFTNDGRLWIGTSDGVYFYSSSIFYKYAGFEGDINAINSDSAGNIWFGATSGLYRINKENKLEFINDKTGLPHNFINDLCIDFEGSLWLANYKGGLTQVSDGKFNNYSALNGLKGKVVNSITEIAKNKYIIAFDNGCLNLLNNGIVEDYYPSKRLEGERIRHVLYDSKGIFWYSTYAGLLKIDKGREQWYNTENGFPDTRIRLAFEDSQGRIWVGTRNNGVIVINNDGSLVLFNRNNGLQGQLIMSINEDFEGNIYISTNEGGVNVIHENKIIKVYNRTNGLLSDIVFNTYHDKSGNLWIAQNGGLSIVHNNHIYGFNHSNGLANEVVFDVIEDDFGTMWLSTNEGVVRLSKQSVFDCINGTVSNITTRLFDHKDGMTESECNASSKIVKGRDGKILFPTINGLSIVIPSIEIYNNYVPPVYIEDVLLNNKSVFDGSKISYQSGKERITFKYTSLSYVEPSKNRFKYQLIGFDEEAIEVRNERSISYTNLPAGNYTFKIVASNNDGVWNNDGDEIKIKIIPRFFETKLFYALLFALFFIVIFVSYFFRINFLKRQRNILESKVKYRTQEIQQQKEELISQKEEILKQTEILDERKKQLEEINLSKDKMFSIIAHDLRSPLGNFKSLLDHLTVYPDKIDELKRNKILNSMSEIANGTFELLENLLFWSRSQMGAISLNPEPFILIDIVESVFRTVRPSADKKGICIHVDIETSISAYADSNMIRTVIRNLLMNAIKFTGRDGEITIKASIKKQMVQVAISDNGIGINEDIVSKIFNIAELHTTRGTENEKGSGLGLVICKEFVEKNGGKIWVESQVKKGSAFYFTLPVNAFSAL